MVSRVLEFCRFLDTLSWGKSCQVSMSMGYAHRVVFTGGGMPKELSVDNVVEIVDYDPLKQVMMLIGRNPPVSIAALHWMIHHAREDVHAVVCIENTEISKDFIQDMKMTDEISSNMMGTLDSIKTIMKTLGTTNHVRVKKYGVLFVDQSLEHIKKIIEKE